MEMKKSLMPNLLYYLSIGLYPDGYFSLALNSSLGDKT